MKKLILRIIITIVVFVIAQLLTDIECGLTSKAYWTVYFLSYYAVGGFFDYEKEDK